MRRLLLCCALIFAPSVARAHLDCHGMAIDRAENLGCCGVDDGHSFSDGSHFRKDSGGVWHYMIGESDYEIRQTSEQPIEPLPSTDGCYTVWERSADEETGEFHPNGDIKAGLKSEDIHWYCLEIPMTASEDSRWLGPPLWVDPLQLSVLNWIEMHLVPWPLLSSLSAA
jgi:hypothetical protein